MKNNPKTLKRYRNVSVVEYTFGNGEKEHFVEIRLNLNNVGSYHYTVSEAKMLAKTIREAVEFATKNNGLKWT